MRRQYDIYIHAISELSLYKQILEDLKIETVELDGKCNVLLDVRYAENKWDAINQVADKYDLDPETLHAELHTVDVQVKAGPNVMQVNGYQTDTECGCEIHLPDGQILQLTLWDINKTQDETALCQILLPNGTILTVKKEQS